MKMTQYTFKQKNFLDYCKNLKKEQIKALSDKTYNWFYNITKLEATFDEKCFEYVAAVILKRYYEPLSSEVDQRILLVFVEMYRPIMFSSSMEDLILKSFLDYSNDWKDVIEFLKENHSWIINEKYGKKIEGEVAKSAGPFVLIDLNIEEDQNTYKFSKLHSKFETSKCICPKCKENLQKAIFEQGKEFQLSTLEGIKNINEIYTCENCNIFIGSNEEHKINSGKIYYKKIVSKENYKIHLNIFNENAKDLYVD